MDRAVFDRMAEIDNEHWWFAARREIIARLIERQAEVRRPLRILEVGCGTGSNLELLQRYGRVDAIEPDDPARALATARSGVAVKGGLLPDGVHLEDGAYDLIVLLDVLEHIPDDRGTLAALRSKLAPGGKLMVTVPAAPWMWSAHDLGPPSPAPLHGALPFRGLRRGGLPSALSQPLQHGAVPAHRRGAIAGKLLGREGGDDAIPPKPLNRLLKGLFGAERHLVGRAALPFGVSSPSSPSPRTGRGCRGPARSRPGSGAGPRPVAARQSIIQR
jgi:SAM-dependent methyltransferase